MKLGLSMPYVISSRHQVSIAALALSATLFGCFHSEYRAVQTLRDEYKSCVEEYSAAHSECEAAYIRLQDAQRDYEETAKDFFSDGE